MSLRKPILRVTRECPKCDGYAIEIRKPHIIRMWKPYYVYDDCKKCKGIGRIDVKRNDPKFKKYYKIALEERVEDLTTEYRNAKTTTFNIGEELRKHCKELDKVVNK